MADLAANPLRARADQMAVNIARQVRDGETVFFGLASPLVMVSVLLAKATWAPNLTVLSIPGGVGAELVRLPASTVDGLLFAGSRAVFTLADVFDLSARGRLDLVFLSGVQIDGRGRINMSAIGSAVRPQVRLPGGAGSALLLPTARRTVLWRTRHDPRTFVEHLDFCTASGNTEAVVTPLCTFRRNSSGRLAIGTLNPGVTEHEVRSQTGFALPDTTEDTAAAPPSREELACLQRIDPEGVRYAEF